MRALEFITGHVIYNPAYTYKFQLKTTIDGVEGLDLTSTYLVLMSFVMSFVSQELRSESVR